MNILVSFNVLLYDCMMAFVLETMLLSQIQVCYDTLADIKLFYKSCFCQKSLLMNIHPCPFQQLQGRAETNTDIAAVIFHHCCCGQSHNFDKCCSNKVCEGGKQCYFGVIMLFCWSNNCLILLWCLSSPTQNEGRHSAVLASL